MALKGNLTAVADTVADVILEKTASPATRAGVTVERVGKMVEADVHAEVIALQLSMNSPNGHHYSAAFVNELARLYEDSKTRVGFTAAQARTLIRDQQLIAQNMCPVPA